MTGAGTRVLTGQGAEPTPAAEPAPASPPAPAPEPAPEVEAAAREKERQLFAKLGRVKKLPIAPDE